MDHLPRIIIVDDFSLFRRGISVLVEQSGIATVIGEAGNGQEFLELVKSLDPDLVLMDIEMPVMNGLEATKEAIKLKPQLKILVLTVLEGPQHCAGMIAAGAMGFIHKSATPEVFKKAIDTVAGGHNYYTIDVLRMLATHDEKLRVPPLRKQEPRIELSDREREVLNYFCQGLSVPEIACRIFRSVKTVEAHRSSLLHKTNTRNTLNLVLFAISNNLVEIQ